MTPRNPVQTFSLQLSLHFPVLVDHLYMPLSPGRILEVPLVNYLSTKTPLAFLPSHVIYLFFID